MVAPLLRNSQFFCVFNKQGVLEALSMFDTCCFYCDKNGWSITNVVVKDFKIKIPNQSLKISVYFVSETKLMRKLVWQTKQKNILYRSCVKNQSRINWRSTMSCNCWILYARPKKAKLQIIFYSGPVLILHRGLWVSEIAPLTSVQ